MATNIIKKVFKVKMASLPLALPLASLPLALPLTSLPLTSLPLTSLPLANLSLSVAPLATQYVLEPCPIPLSVNVEMLKTNVATYLGPRVPFYKDTNRNMEIEDEFSEYWLTKASNGVHIGKGSGGMDVKTSINEGIDALCVVMNKYGSNEKSLMQNFSGAGSSLDSLFNEEKHEEALDLYVKGYKDKIMKTKEKENLSDLYFIAFVSTKTDVYLVCLKLIVSLISNVKSAGFTTKKNKNILTENFIDPKYGTVRLYKSKKRLELRLDKSILQDSNTIKLYSPPSAKE